MIRGSRLVAAVLVGAGVSLSALLHAQPGAAATPKAAGGSLTIAFPYQPDTLDPVVGSQTIQSQIDRHIFDTLVWELPNGQITPLLATNWTISNQGKTYTFSLRHGVTFQDGSQFNAAAVVDNLNRIEAPSSHAGSSLAALGPFKSAKAGGAYKLIISMKKPYSPFLTNLGQPPLGIVSPASVKKYGSTVGEHPVGTGPFALSKWNKGSNLVLVRNPHYSWGPPALHVHGPAKLAQITYDFIQSGQTRVQELQTGQAQLMDSTPALYFKTFKGNPSYHTIAASLGGSGEYGILNNKKWPTNSFAVRQAILYSVDRAGVIKLADSGVYPVLGGPLQRGMLAYDTTFDHWYPYNPSRAAKILTANGWKKVNGIWTKNGRQLSLVLNGISGVEDLPTLMEAIQGYLNKAGFVTKLEEMAEPAWNANWERGVENITSTWFTGVDPDILRETWTPSQPFDWNKYSNPTVTRLLDAASTSTNSSRRATMYRQAQTIIMSQAATMPLHENDDLIVMSSGLTGVTFSGGIMVLYTASLK